MKKTAWRTAVAIAPLILFLVGCTPKHVVFDADDGQDLRASLKKAVVESKSTTLRAGVNVDIRTDTNGVPHIEGAQSHVVFFAQGFTHAYYRLWQIEALSRVVEGTWSELGGTAGLAVDRFSRHLRLNESAKRSNEKMMALEETRQVAEAFAAGVNARIQQLDRSSMPIEFQKLGLKPRVFQTIDIARIMTYLNWGIGDPLEEIKLSRTRADTSAELFSRVFPWPGLIPETPVFRAVRNYAPAPKTPIVLKPGETAVSLPLDSALQTLPNTGSNVFVIPGSMTKSGAPIIANDFHMKYVLPVMYVPMQIASDEFNAAGASIVGVPGIPSGTNGHVAWGYVSSLIDSSDWYRLRLVSNDPESYEWNGTKRKFEIETVELHPREAAPEKLLLRRSVVGPMVPAVKTETGTADLAFAWASHDGHNYLLPLLRRLKAVNAKDCFGTESILNSSAYLLSCADRVTMGAWLLSPVPIRPPWQDPRVVNEASSDRDLWQGYYPADSNPHEFPMTSPIVTSNQFIHSKKEMPYLGWNFSPGDRAGRIQTLLVQKKKWDAADVEKVQSDIVSHRIEMIRSVFIETGQMYLAKKKASECAVRVVGLLEKWSGEFDENRVEPRLFAVWAKIVENRIWEHHLGSESTHKWPNTWILTQLVNQRTFDDLWNFPKTKPIETRTQIIEEGLERVCLRVTQTGRPLAEFKWRDVYTPKFSSFAGVPFAELKELYAPGSASTVFSQSGVHGTVYRSIISLEKETKFRFVAVGGVSGDPVSPRSGAWFRPWAERRLLDFPIWPRAGMAQENAKERESDGRK